MKTYVKTKEFGPVAGGAPETFVCRSATDYVQGIIFVWPPFTDTSIPHCHAPKASQKLINRSISSNNTVVMFCVWTSVIFLKFLE